jgi:hypothetical protein
MYPQQGKIKYLIGVGLKQGLRPKVKTVFLYGAWKFSRKGSVSFEIDYGQGRLREIEFGADVHINRQDQVGLVLTNKRGEPLGISLKFTRQFLKVPGAEAFLRLKAAGRDRGVDAGVRIPF